MTLAAPARHTLPALSVEPREAQLHDAIRAYRAAMPEGELRVFDTGKLDTLGMHACAAFFFTPGGDVSDNFGYGASATEAEVGALGELTEDLGLDQALAKASVVFGSFDDMVAEHGSAHVLNPLELCLPAGSPYTSAQQMAWVKVQSIDRNAQAFAPLETIAYSSYQFRQLVGGRAIEPLFEPITSGLGAGTSRDMALSHGILELLQRDGNCTEFRAMDRGVAIDPEGINDPGIQQLLSRLHAHGVTPIIKLASTEFGICNVYVVGRSDHVSFPLQQTACGEAAHPNAERAIRKALLEFIAARCRKTFMHGPVEPIARITSQDFIDEMLKRVSLEAQEERSMTEMNSWLEKDEAALLALMNQRIFAETSRVSLADLPDNANQAIADPANRLSDLQERLASERIPIYYFDASPEHSSDVAVTKAVIPHLECETMSYHRIGRRGTARLLERGSPLITRAQTHEACKRIRLTPEAEQSLGGPCWFDTQAADAIVGELYPLYREPSSFALQRYYKEKVA